MSAPSRMRPAISRTDTTARAVRIPREGTQSGGASVGTTGRPVPIDGSVVVMLLGTAVSERYSGWIRRAAATRDSVLSEAAIAAGVVSGARRDRKSVV